MTDRKNGASWLVCVVTSLGNQLLGTETNGLFDLGALSALVKYSAALLSSILQSDARKLNHVLRSDLAQGKFCSQNTAHAALEVQAQCNLSVAYDMAQRYR